MSKKQAESVIIEFEPLYWDAIFQALNEKGIRWQKKGKQTAQCYATKAQIEAALFGKVSHEGWLVNPLPKKKSVTRHKRNLPEHYIVMWDWKDQPDWDEIDAALEKLVAPAIVPVDTGGDWFAVVVLERESKAQAQKLYDLWEEEMDS